MPYIFYSFRSIRFNKLKSWGGFLWKDTPSIKYLNLEGNNNFIVKKKLLRKTTIQKLDHISISKKCRYCMLTRVNVTRDHLKPSRRCLYLPVEHYHLLDEMVQRYILFEGSCFGNTTCDYVLTSLTNYIRKFRDKCWDVTLKTKYFEYFLGIVAMAANFIVVLVTTFSKSLRKSAAFCLVGHMAFCDIFMGVYSTGIAHGHRLAGNMMVFRRWRWLVCPYWRTTFMVGQMMSVLTCLLVTVERYLSIIFCMKPFIRLERLPAMGLVLGFWVMSSIVSYFIQVIDRPSITDNFMCLLVRNFDVSGSFNVSQSVILISVTIYLTIVILYIHIYTFVKKSRRNTGVKRESQLASRIGLVILSNTVFFVVPNVTIIIVTTGSLYFDISDEANSTLRRWLPPMCLVFNACINPFLFAFRNDKFQAAFKALFHGNFKRVSIEIMEILGLCNYYPNSD